MSEIHQKLADMMEKMPAFPHSVQRIISITSSIDCAPKDLVQVIEHDPVITLKILKLVNSPYFGLMHKVTSAQHAIVYLGVNTVKNMAISIAALGAIPRQHCAGFNSNQFMEHALLTASFARTLGRILKISERDLSDYFVAGLLHDVGQVLFASALPQIYQDVLRQSKNICGVVELEQKLLGIDHAQAGAWLAEKWLLPEAVVLGVQHHHATIGDLATPLSDAIYMANHFAELSEENKVDLQDRPHDQLVRFAMEYDHLKMQLGDIEKERKKAKELVLHV